MRWLWMVLFLLVGMSAWAQQPVQGEVIAHPEALSGVWEARTKTGATAGIRLSLMTVIPGAAKSLATEPQSLKAMEAYVYLRKGAEVHFGDERGFYVAPGSPAHWDGRRLTVKVVPPARDVAIDLDLLYDPIHNTWTGLFHKDEFSGQVRLRRPRVAYGKTSPWVGTWVHVQSPVDRCLHIAQAEDGSLQGWTDVLQAPGQWRYANNVKPPAESWERYGDMVKVRPEEAGIQIGFGEMSGGCCPSTYTGRLSADGSRIEGSSDLRAGGQFLITGSWTRSKEDSCRR
ncbi:MAG TPA: hypothetical protein VGC07_02705 [Granulicella sp.]